MLLLVGGEQRIDEVALVAVDERPQGHGAILHVLEKEEGDNDVSGFIHFS